jgi:hypothetical protein
MFLLLALLPWIVVVVPAAKALRRATSPILFLAIWCAFILVFFSASRSKLADLHPADDAALGGAARATHRGASDAPQPCHVDFTGARADCGNRTRRHSFTTLAAAADFGARMLAIAVVLAIVSVTSAKRSWMAPAAASILSFQALMMSYSALPPVKQPNLSWQRRGPTSGPTRRCSASGNTDRASRRISVEPCGSVSTKVSSSSA